MIHMTIQQLSSYLDAGLAPDSMERVGIHLSSCAECTNKFTAIERQADRIAAALGHDPGDLLSERFERMVDERILSGRLMTAPRPTAVRALPPLPDAPPVAVPRARMPGDDPAREGASVLSGAGEGMKRTANAVATSVRSLTTPRRREEDRSRPWSVAWAAALILVVIVSGVGIVVSRIGLLPSWSLPSLELASMPGTNAPEPRDGPTVAPPEDETGSWAVPPGTPLNAETGLQAATGAEPQLAPSPEPAMVQEAEPAMSAELPAGHDAFGSSDLPAEKATGRGAATTSLRGDELLPSGSIPGATPEPEAPAPAREPSGAPLPASTPAEAARLMSERAATDPSSSTYEAAARAWEAALGSLHGGEYQEGRWRIAEARYRAWQMDPEEGQRASRATAAIRAYLIAAPPGEERDQARAWLNVIRESGFRHVDSPR